MDLYDFVEEVTRGLTPLDPEQIRGEDVIFFDSFEPFQRPYSEHEVKDKHCVEAERRGIVPDLLQFEDFLLPKRSLLDRIKLKKGHLTRDQLKWILSTSKKLRERAAVLKLEEEVRELKETLFYARKKNKEIKRVIKKNEQKLSKMVNNSTTQEGDSCYSPEQLLYSLKFPQQSNPLNMTYS